MRFKIYRQQLGRKLHNYFSCPGCGSTLEDGEKVFEDLVTCPHCKSEITLMQWENYPIKDYSEKETRESTLNPEVRLKQIMNMRVKNLAQAFWELTNSWSEEDDLYNEYLIPDYPFDKSIQDLNSIIRSWQYKVENRIFPKS